MKCKIFIIFFLTTTLYQIVKTIEYKSGNKIPIKIKSSTPKPVKTVYVCVKGFSDPTEGNLTCLNDASGNSRSADEVNFLTINI
jgi:hypothetical protein